MATICSSKQTSAIKILPGIQRAALALLAAFLLAPSAWPWSRLGHRVTASFAEKRLALAAKAAVRDLLGPAVSLADISTWADEQKEIPRTASWHYMNVPITESRYDPKFCQRGGCVVSNIEDFRRILQDTTSSKIEKQQALKFLIHLIADLHQPLHVGDTGSQGGNNIQVRFFDRGSNLHQWDTFGRKNRRDFIGVGAGGSPRSYSWA
jgi:nuclease S1